MATRNPAAMLGWGDAIGSLADGHFADLLVVAGTDGDPYDHLLTAEERDIALVVVDGVARFGRPIADGGARTRAPPSRRSRSAGSTAACS